MRFNGWSSLWTHWTQFYSSPRADNLIMTNYQILHVCQTATLIFHLPLNFFSTYKEKQRHRMEHMEMSYLQDIELNYSISIFIKSLKSPCKRHSRPIFLHLCVNLNLTIQSSEIKLVEILTIFFISRDFVRKHHHRIKYLLNIPSSLTKQQV